MSFKCFISFFIGIFSYMIGQKMIIWYGKPIFCAIVLIAGFLVAQIVCYTVHSYMKEKHHVSELLKDDNTFKW